MDRQDRKAAVAAYKERAPAWGGYAVICNATGEAWVGASRHVDTQRNGLWFTLKLGRCRHAALQSAWNAHGEAEFRFEELDRLQPDFSEMLRADEIKKRRVLWRARLQARDL